MNWISNICSCISPELQNTVISYLNSNQLNRQVIEQEKLSERQQEVPLQQSIYDRAKQRRYNFGEQSENNYDAENYYNKEEEQSDEQQEQIINAFWYPSKKKREGFSQDKLFNMIYTEKSKILRAILFKHPNTANYDKIYDSQDDLALNIYSKIENPIPAKRINVFRFTFALHQVSLKDYEDWLKSDNTNIEPLLECWEKLDNIDFCDLSFHRKHYKKMLVINPHTFVLASKSEKLKVDQEEDDNSRYLTTVFSIHEEKEGSPQQLRGWANLCGMEIFEEQYEDEKGSYLRFEGYMNIQLKTTLSPSMLKQPLAKQIRIFVQKLSCSIKKSDQL